MQLITKEELQSTLTRSMRGRITDELVNDLNNLVMDDQIKEIYRENLLSFTSVIRDGKYKIKQYVDAVRYSTHKLMGKTNVVAYMITFPERWARLIAENTDQVIINSFAGAYQGTQLVQKIMEQSMTPTHVVNADIFQKAINRQASIMMDPGASFHVQSKAADSLLTHLKAPEAVKIKLDIGIKQDSVIDDLRASTQKLVQQQRAMLEASLMSTKEMAHSVLIIDGEVTDEQSK